MEPGIVNAFYDGDWIAVVRRDAAGLVSIERIEAEHSLFIRAEQLTRALLYELTSGPPRRWVRRVRREGQWVRIGWSDRDMVKKAVAWLEDELGIETFEGNVSPLRRWMVDQGVRPVRPRAAYLDIETDSRVEFARKTEARIFCVTVTCHETRRRTEHVLEADTDEAEARMLAELWAALEGFDQLIAWSGDGFDFPVLKARTRRAGLDIEPRRWLYLDQLEVFRRQNAMGAESGAEKESYGLDNVARTYGLKGKLELDANQTREAWEQATPCASGECMACRRCLVRYCGQDTDLLPQLEDATAFLELLWTVCDATGVLFDTRGNNPGGQVESFLLRLGLERDFRFRTRFPDEENAEKFAGAYVQHPTERGILRDVHVCDFSRMYPSIIVAWNMSPETKLERPVDERAGMPLYRKGSPAWEAAGQRHARAMREIPAGVAQAATGARFCTDVEGILPAAVRRLMDLRRESDELKARLPPGSPEWVAANRTSSAYKVAVNSFYGVVGSRGSMFFDVEIGEGITQTGKWLIQQTAAAGKRRLGLTSIYGDTDSVMLSGCSDEEFRRFVAWCNDELYPGLLVEQGARPGWVKIAYEKKFDRLVFGTTDRGELAAKKYAAKIAHFKGSVPKPGEGVEIKGLEYKRGDANAMARRFQREVVDGLMLCDCEDPQLFEAWVEAWRAYVHEQPLALGEVQRSQSLSRPLRDYAVRVRKEGIPLGQVEVRRVLKDALLVDSAFASFLGGTGRLRVPDSWRHPDSTVNEKRGSVGELVVYHWTHPAHVWIGMMLLARGREVRQGTRIAWVVSDGTTSPKTAIPAEDYRGELDRHELWEDAVWPPVRRLLAGAFPRWDWSRFDRTRPRKPRPPPRGGGSGPKRAADLEAAGQLSLLAGMIPAK